MTTTRFDYWASDSTYELTLERARDFYDSERYADALVLYRNLMASSVDADIYYETASCHHKLKDYETAVSLFEKSLQLNDRRWLAFTKLADCYYNLKMFNKAIHNATLARTLKPDDLNGILNLAKYYSENNMLFECTYFYNKYLQTATDKRTETYKEISKKLNDARSGSTKYLNMAYSSFNRKELLPAQNAYLQAMKLFPINYDANYNLALIYKDLRQPQKAIEFFLRALMLNPKETNIFMLIATEYSKLSDFTRAYCFVKRYLNTMINQNQTKYLTALKNLKFLEPHIDKDFIPSTSKYISQNQYLNAYYELENAVLLNNKTVDKIELTNLELMIFPEKSLSNLYNKKGAELYNSGKLKEADKYFTRVMEIASKDSDEYKFAKARLTYV